MTDTTHDTAPAGEPQATDAPPAPPEPAQGDQPLGEAGLKALQKEREARKALERQLAELAPLKQLADLLGGRPTGDAKTDLERLTERMDQYERQITEERIARWRAEVAAEKGLSPALAERLRGSTKEELAADADVLLALVPAQPPGPRNPMPDPSQGVRSGTASAQLTRDDLKRMSPHEIVKAKAEGRLKALLGGE